MFKRFTECLDKYGLIDITRISVYIRYDNVHDRYYGIGYGYINGDGFGDGVGITELKEIIFIHKK